LPTIGTVFDEARLTEIAFALEAHAGELDRIDYRKALRGRGEMNSALGPELLFGFRSKSDAGPYVELLTEAVLVRGRWFLGRAHWFDVDEYAVEPSDVELTAWLDAPSVSDMFGPPGSQNREETT
jgi:hypothetical protein